MYPELVLVLFMLLGFTIYAHGATTSTQHHNSLGVVQYVDNPNAYIEGSIKCREQDACGEVRRGGKIVTELNFNPSHTYALYSEKISFCGGVADSFQGKTGVLVVTYRRSVHETPGGVACHDLVGVHRVQEETPEWQTKE